jgi:tricorn protease
VFDTKSRSDKKIAITVRTTASRCGLARSAAKDIENVAISPKGERVVICARGDVFSAPAEKGPTRNLTHLDAHDRAA